MLNYNFFTGRTLITSFICVKYKPMLNYIPLKNSVDTTLERQEEKIILKKETFEVVSGEMVVRDITTGICEQVRRILAKAHPFVMYPYDKRTDFASSDYKIERRAIMGYGGESTFPVISDPTEEYRGAVGIFDDKLVYSTVGIPLHEYRDSYRYAGQCGLDHTFFINAGFVWVVQQFTDQGLPIYLSTDMLDFDRHHPFSIGEQIDIIKMTLISRNLEN